MNQRIFIASLSFPFHRAFHFTDHIWLQFYGEALNIQQKEFPRINAEKHYARENIIIANR